MANRILISGLLAASVLAGATAAGAASIDASRQATIDGLAGQLRQVLGLVPSGSKSQVYEAQLVSTVDQANVECPIALAAVRQVQGGTATESEQQALNALGRRVARCGARGTGALAGGGPLAFTSSAVLGGGGSNYQ